MMIPLAILFQTVKSFLPAMLEKDHGHILNIASSVGLFTLRNLSDYSASKFGVVGFTECLDYEITFTGCKNVHTTLVCPHHIKTQLFRGCKQKWEFILFSEISILAFMVCDLSYKSQQGSTDIPCLQSLVELYVFPLWPSCCTDYTATGYTWTTAMHGFSSNRGPINSRCLF